jgi:hypothetical protein
MDLGILKRLSCKFNDPMVVLYTDGITYKEVLTMNKEDVSYDLNTEVPKLYIKGQDVGVVSMTNQYVTKHPFGEGTNVITFVYVTKDNTKQKVLSINRITGEVLHQ